MMNRSGAVVERRTPSRKACRHHWVIESPHGATSLGYCKRCKRTKRFPNAAEDLLWNSERAGLGRWGRSRDSVKPITVGSPKRSEDGF